MADRPAPSLPPLQIEADLDLEIDGERVRVGSDGQRLLVDLPSVRAARGLVGPLGQNEGAVAFVHAALTEADVTAEVRLGGETLARLGAGTRPSRLAKYLGLEGAELDARQAFRQLTREQPLAVAGVAVGLIGLAAVGLYARLRD